MLQYMKRFKQIQMHDICSRGIVWNRSIVMLVFLTIPLVEFAGDVVPIDPRNLRFLRLIRVLRLLRAAKVFRFVKNVEELAESIGRASPSLVHMILLLMVFYFCFGVMGVAFFGLMCKEGDEAEMMRCLITSEHSRLPYSQSFQHMGSAFLTLFRVSSGDAWSDYITRIGMTSRTSTLFYREPDYMNRAKKWLAAFNKASNDFEIKEAISQLQLALPGCVSEEELRELEDGVSIDCSIPNHCDSTCGGLTAYFFLPFFVILTNFVVMKLIIPPLMIEIGRQLAIGHTLPGTDKLVMTKFQLIYKLWQRQAYAKKYVLWVEEYRLANQLRAGSRRSKSSRASGLARTGSSDTLLRASSAEEKTVVSRHAKLLPGAGTKYQGLVRKRGQVNTSYQQRFFVLDGDGWLKYFKDKAAWDTGKPPLGSIACSNLIAQAVGKGHDPADGFCFALTDANEKQVQCSVESAHLREMWLKFLGKSSAEVFYSHSEAQALLAQEHDGTLSTSHEGVVRKRGQTNTAFAERYFVLAAGSLKYYKSKKDVDLNHKAQGELLCKGLQVEAAPTTSDRKTEFDFIITDAQGKRIICCVPSEVERDVWLSKLSKAAAESDPPSTSGTQFGPVSKNLSLSQWEHEGPVKKRGQVNTTFADRYFVLSQGVLKYYKKKTDVAQGKKEQGTIHCRNLRVEEHRDEVATNLRFVFTLIDEDGKRVECQVNTSHEAERWIECLRGSATAFEEQFLGRSDVVRYEGFVKKRGQMNTAFQRRYFAIQQKDGQEMVCYYRSKQQFDTHQRPQGSLQCDGLVVTKDSTKDGMEGFFFILKDAAGKEIVCSVDTPQERDMWISHVKCAAGASAHGAQFEFAHDHRHHRAKNENRESVENRAHASNLVRSDGMSRSEGRTDTMRSEIATRAAYRHQGVVRKRGQINTAFADRFFVLAPEEAGSGGWSLAYYKNESGARSGSAPHPQGVLSCMGMTVG